MRCAKCGYISFDHLSECRKCHASLTGIRDDFGFFHGKPLAASFLDSLLSGYEPPAPGPVTEGEAVAQFVAEEGAGRAMRLEELAREEETSSAAAAERDESVDFSLLDLSDDELDLLIKRVSVEGEEKGEPVAESMSETIAWRPPEKVSQPEPEPPDKEISAPELYQEAAETFVEPEAVKLRTETEPAKFFTEPEPAEAPTVPGPSAESLLDPGLLDDFDDDFGLELSKKELEALLEELETTPKKPQY